MSLVASADMGANVSDTDGKIDRPCCLAEMHAPSLLRLDQGFVVFSKMPPRVWIQMIPRAAPEPSVHCSNHILLFDLPCRRRVAQPLEISASKWKDFGER